MKEVKDLLEGLPEDFATLALYHFDESFFLEKIEHESPLLSPGDALRCAFDWEKSPQGYSFWATIHAEYGNVGYYEN